MTAHVTTPENVDDRIDAWHDGDGEGVDLATYLGWTWAQYAAWVEHSQFPVLASGASALNPPDCICEYTHASCTYCPSVAPSRGAVLDDHRTATRKPEPDLSDVV